MKIYQSDYVFWVSRYVIIRLLEMPWITSIISIHWRNLILLEYWKYCLIYVLICVDVKRFGWIQIFQGIYVLSQFFSKFLWILLFWHWARVYVISTMNNSTGSGQNWDEYLFLDFLSLHCMLIKIFLFLLMLQQ